MARPSTCGGTGEGTIEGFSDSKGVKTHIVNLKGRTLRTLARGEAFDTEAVKQNALILALRRTGKEQRVGRDEIENAYRGLVTAGKITRVEIRKKYPRVNPAHIAAS